MEKAVMADKFATPYKIFYSYAHQDESLQKELEKHLTILKRQGFITTWHCREIKAGVERQDESSIHLEEAHLILLLVSPDFMASDCAPCRCI